MLDVSGLKDLHQARLPLYLAANSAINADLIGKTWESPQAVPIGSVACGFVIATAIGIVLLDLNKLFQVSGVFLVQVDTTSRPPFLDNREKNSTLS